MKIAVTDCKTCQGKNETFLLTGMVLYGISEESDKDFSRNGQRLFFYRRPAINLLYKGNFRDGQRLFASGFDWRIEKNAVTLSFVRLKAMLVCYRMV